MTETKTFGRRRALPDKRAEAFDKGASEGKGSHEGGVSALSSTAGWGGMDKMASAAGGDLFLKVEEKPTIIKILDASPFDNYVAHWLDEVEEGSKSIRCWADAGSCPLCAIGDKPKKFSACFNVISLEDPALPVLRVWEAGVKIARQLKEIALDDKKGPLDRADLYFSIKKVQKAKAVEYILERIRSRDLEEETGVKPLPDSKVAEFLADCHTDPVKETLDAETMEELVKLLLDD